MDIDSIIKEVTQEICARPTENVIQSSRGTGAENVAKYIDHTLLKADASMADVKKVCDEAKRYNFASVCVNSSYIKFVAEQLEGSGVKPCCVVGFPLGAMPVEAKAAETQIACEKGAKEIDMVVNIGAVKSGDWKLVFKDIEAVVAAARGSAIVKVIIEACLLTDEEKVKTCAIAKLAKAHFVKTSTGFSTGGATAEDIGLMRKTVGPEMGIKAAGGVRTYADAIKMIDAGATRLGTSAGVEIVTGAGSECECVNCGACTVNCPAGRIAVIKDKY